MKDLLFFLLRLLLQLVIFAITGRWPHLAHTRTPRPPPPGGEARRARPRKARRTGAPAPTQSWSPHREGALYAPYPPPPEGGPVRARSATMQAKAPSTRSLGRALRDRRVLRDALALDAALGSRRPRF